MKFQPRDEQILSLLSKYGVLSTRQLRCLAFKDISHTTALRRLRILEKGDLIVRVLGLSDGLHAWSLGRQGARAIGEDLPFRFTNRNETEHEVTLSQVRISLDRFGFGKDWTSGTEMKRAGYEHSRRRETSEKVIPDGIFTANYRASPEVIAVELELHAKARARYEKLLTQYAAKSAIHFIWYIVPRASIGNAVLDEWRKIPSWRKSNSAAGIGYSLLSEAIESPESMKLYQPEGKPIPFFGVFQPEPKPKKAKPKEPETVAKAQPNDSLPAQAPAHPLGSENEAAA